MNIKSTPPAASSIINEPNASNTPITLPEKTNEIEKDSASFRQILRQKTQPKLQPAKTSPQKIKENSPQHQKQAAPQQKRAHAQSQSKPTPQNSIKKNTAQHQKLHQKPSALQQQNKTPPQNKIKKNTAQHQKLHQEPPALQQQNKTPPQNKIKKNTAQHQKLHQEPPALQQQNKTPPQNKINENDKNTTDPIDSIQDSPATAINTPPNTPPNMTSSPIAADQAATISPVSPAERTAFIEKVSQKILLSSADGAQNASLRIELNDDLLPQTQLTAQKQPDGSLNLTFTTDHPQSTHLLLQAQSGLTTHMQHSQSLNVQITLVNEQGQPLSEQNTANQNQSDQQNKKPEPDWNQVEAHLKKL